MEQNILVTYKHMNGYSTFAWFTSIDEADDFITNDNEVSEVIECADCTNAKQLDTDRLDLYYR